MFVLTVVLPVPLRKKVLLGLYASKKSKDLYAPLSSLRYPISVFPFNRQGSITHQSSHQAKSFSGEWCSVAG